MNKKTHDALSQWREDQRWTPEKHKELTAAARPGPVARQRIISRADFVVICELAYREKHTRSLAAQMAEALGMAKPNGEKSCQRWLDQDGPPPPYDVISDAYNRADNALTACADAMDRVAQALGKLTT